MQKILIMVQFLLFFDRLIFNAASEKPSSPITQNEMNNMDAKEICSMAEVIAPYLEYCLSIPDGNIQGGGKKTGGMGSTHHQLRCPPMGGVSQPFPSPPWASLSNSERRRAGFFSLVPAYTPSHLGRERGCLGG